MEEQIIDVEQELYTALNSTLEKIASALEECKNSIQEIKRTKREAEADLKKYARHSQEIHSFEAISQEYEKRNKEPIKNVKEELKRKANGYIEEYQKIIKRHKVDEKVLAQLNNPHYYHTIMYATEAADCFFDAISDARESFSQIKTTALHVYETVEEMTEAAENMAKAVDKEDETAKREYKNEIEKKHIEYETLRGLYRQAFNVDFEKVADPNLDQCVTSCLIAVWSQKNKAWSTTPKEAAQDAREHFEQFKNQLTNLNL